MSDPDVVSALQDIAKNLKSDRPVPGSKPIRSEKPGSRVSISRVQEMTAADGLFAVAAAIDRLTAAIKQATGQEGDK